MQNTRMHANGDFRRRSVFAIDKRVFGPIESLESRILLSHTWYVATGGVNSNPGTFAKPFGTIQYAADQAAPGDTVLIFGGVYHESVTVHDSGTSAAPIVFKSYGDSPVTIDGANPITGWTQSSGSIYTANMPENLGTGNNQLFVDGTMVSEARWPNNALDINHPPHATMGVVVNTPGFSTIYNKSMTQPAGFWVGGYIKFGPGQDWVQQTGQITASGPGWVTFSYVEGNAFYEAPKTNNHFELFGVAGALDSAGEWFRNSNGKVSLWTPDGTSPAKHTVEVKARTYGFNISASNISIEDIDLFACTIKTSKTSNNVVIDGMQASYISHFSLAPVGWTPPMSGIVLAGSGDVLENSTIAYSAGDGVYVTGVNDVVKNNVIHGIDYMGVDAAPVHLTGSNAVVTGNTLYNAGRDGIFFAYGSNDTITHNLVHDYGLQDTDLGGFYCCGTNGHGTVIAYNEFYNGVTGGFGGSGIMLDNDSSNVIIHHNIVTNVNSALRINKTALNVQVYNNTLDATGWSLITISSLSDWTGSILDNNIFTKGVLFGRHSTHVNNITNNGMFVDPTHQNFALMQGAPAINAGIPIKPYTTGYMGSEPDDGALMYGMPAFAVGATILGVD